MRAYKFVTVDVFTDRRFGGNPLAVFPGARGLNDAVGDGVVAGDAAVDWIDLDVEIVEGRIPPRALGSVGTAEGVGVSKGPLSSLCGSQGRVKQDKATDRLSNHRVPRCPIWYALGGSAPRRFLTK